MISDLYWRYRDLLFFKRINLQIRVKRALGYGQLTLEETMPVPPSWIHAFKICPPLELPCEIQQALRDMDSLYCESATLTAEMLEDE